MPRFTLYAFEGDRDQVVRLHEFKAARPEWNISFDYTVGVWRGRRNLENGVDYHVRHLLEHLLDKLESLYPASPEPPDAAGR